MTGTEPGHRRYAFGEFTLDVDRAALLRGDREVPLRPKSFEVLLYLVEHAGVLVERRALMDAVWGSTIVTEDSLTQCIIDVRRALDDRHQHLVRTVRRRGFILDVAVRMDDAHAPAGTDAPSTKPAVAVETPPASLRKRAGLMVGLATALVATAIGWWLVSERGSPASEPRPAAAAPERSIAVLRFLDLSPAGDQAYFADGLAEEILHLLAQSPDLRVTARGSSFAFGPGDSDIAAVAAQLGVRHVLEGSVRREGDALRVTVQLIDAETQVHVWSRTYDRVIGRMLALQSEIASDVAEALHVTLLQAPHSTSPSVAEAQDLYLLGRHLFHRRGPGDLAAAEGHLERAVQLDPRHARAWAALAGAYNVRALDELRDPAYRLEEQRQALERALEIDPTLAEAHVRLARHLAATGHRGSAEITFARARQLGPRDPLVLGTMAFGEVWDGRLGEGIVLMQQLIEIDPLSALHRGNIGRLLLAAGRYPEAIVELRRAKALSPGLRGINYDIAIALLLSGRANEARQVQRDVPDGPHGNQLEALIGAPPAASAALSRLQAERSAVSHFLQAEAAAYRGDNDAAFEQLEATRLAHAVQPAQVEFDLPQAIMLSPFLRALHDDPRWEILREEIVSPLT